ncbi:tRNA dihydrouridine synthase DusB [Candidatus Woesearchaeota archaeon]|nr:tRNA dihydrouridine synthase DusB [Candidatus Woesearchaeota archaeon]
MKFPKLDSPAILSPMAGVTDVAFRVLCKKYGAGLTYTEFVSSSSIIRNNAKSFNKITVDPCEKPAAIQLFGNSINEVVEAAKLIENRFDIIDVNCGCPAWKVIKTGAGSQLLKDPEKIAKFIEKLTNNVNKPITVKIRSGIDERSINAVRIAKLVEAAGASAITIHGRTQDQGYSGKADWSIIKAVKEQVEIPVIGNGDVFSVNDFQEKIQYSSVDAIMIARGAIGNPFIFTQINQFLKTGSFEMCERLKILPQYLELAGKYQISFPNILRQALFFTKTLERGAILRVQITKCKNLEELETLIYNYIDEEDNILV